MEFTDWTKVVMLIFANMFCTFLGYNTQIRTFKSFNPWNRLLNNLQDIKADKILIAASDYTSGTGWLQQSGFNKENYKYTSTS